MAHCNESEEKAPIHTSCCQPIIAYIKQALKEKLCLLWSAGEPSLSSKQVVLSFTWADEENKVEFSKKILQWGCWFNRKGNFVSKSCSALWFCWSYSPPPEVSSERKGNVTTKGSVFFSQGCKKKTQYIYCDNRVFKVK